MIDSIGPVVTEPLQALSADDISRIRRCAATSRVLVVGSLNVDYLLDVDGSPTDDSTLLVRSSSIAPGGHAGNCASALAQLGVAAALVAAVGADEDGQFLLDDMRARGVSIEYIRQVANTRSGRVHIPLFRDSHCMLMERGANEHLGAHDVSAAFERPWDAVVVFDPSRAALLAAFESTSCREDSPPIFWTPGGLYARDPLSGHLLPSCHTLLVNRHEFSSIRPFVNESSRTDLSKEIVLTRGEHGAQLRKPGSPVLDVAAPHVLVVDPTGAGDTFAAAYVLASLAGLLAPARLALANHAGAFAVRAVGARGAQPTLDELIDAISRATTPSSQLEQEGA
ncbi:carbohydrate kinase family protein [Paraburkholderia azotifigens]|uniref:carbohydrate kinase family protein n=1 Tax=Paraburkholderia azotifigens TaxID=2057004 RepID=UPI0031743AF0